VDTILSPSLTLNITTTTTQYAGQAPAQLRSELVQEADFTNRKHLNADSLPLTEKEKAISFKAA